MKRSVITSNKHGISELRHDMPNDARLRMLRPRILRPRTQDLGCYGKRHVKIFPAGGDPAPPPRKITFHGRIQRDVPPAEKVVLCYRPKTRHMLGENCPVVTPTTNDSSMSLAEQSDIPGESAAPAQPESSVETQTSTEPQQTPSPTQGEAGKESSSVDDWSGSDSDSGSSSESGDDMKSLRDFPLQEIFPKWYRNFETSIFRQALSLVLKIILMVLLYYYILRLI